MRNGSVYGAGEGYSVFTNRGGGLSLSEEQYEKAMCLLYAFHAMLQKKEKNIRHKVLTSKSA